MPFGIASFRSRQQVFAFEAALSRGGVRAEVVSTPREVALGCGLSVRVSPRNFRAAVSAFRSNEYRSFLGAYEITRAERGSVARRVMS